jgi:hypothetical protein
MPENVELKSRGLIWLSKLINITKTKWIFCRKILIFKMSTCKFLLVAEFSTHNLDIPTHILLLLYSCEIVAHRENFVDRPESYNSFSAKNCIFLAHEKKHTSGVYFSIPIHNLTQSKVSKNSKDIFLLLSYHH